MPIITTSAGGATPHSVDPATGKVTDATAPGTTSPSSGAGGIAYYAQPLFDSRIYSLVFPMGAGSATAGTTGGAYNGGLTRGMMVWDKAYSPYKDKAQVHFLFNPTTVTASYSIDATDISASLVYRSPADTAMPAFAMNQSISFSLYYDRTFELWGAYSAAGAPNAKQISTTSGKTTTFNYNLVDPTVYGVNVDILAMKQITGQFFTSYQVNAANAGSASPQTTNNPGVTQQGVMSILPTWVYFGAATGMVYYGYVSDFTVTVTHWTQYMVPMRCVIDVDFALLLPPVSEPNGPSFTNWSVFEQLASGTAAAATTPASNAGKAGR